MTDNAWIQLPGWANDVRIAYRPGSPDEDVLEEIFGPGDVYHLRHDPIRDAIAGGLIIDAGANIGAFASAALALGARFVFCFEPQEENFQLLHQNLSAHWGPEGERWAACPAPLGFDIERLVVEGEAANARTRPAHEGEPSMRAVSFPLAMQMADEAIREAVPGLPSFQQIQMLKIDIEGAEYDWLRNADFELMRRVGRISMEWHSWPHDIRPYGWLCEKLAWTHSISAFGAPDRGGHIHAHPYE